MRDIIRDQRKREREKQCNQQLDMGMENDVIMATGRQITAGGGGVELSNNSPDEEGPQKA